MPSMRISSPIDALLENLGRYVCPIYVKQDIRRQTPFLIGTGTLFRDGDESYLITADHVIEAAGDDDLIIGTDNGLVVLRGQQISWQHEPKPNIAYDICVIRIHPLVADQLINFYRFSTPTDVSDISEYNKLVLYAFVSHPHTRNKPQRATVNKIVITPFYYLLREFLDLKKLKSAGKSSTTHFALYAPFKNSLT